MKEKSLDEKVYEILCAKFDQMVNEHTEAWMFKDMYDAGIVYAEDLYKRKNAFYNNTFSNPIFFHPNSKVFDDMFIVKDSWDHEKFAFKVKVDNFECVLPICELVRYIVKFHKLSHHKGKHEIDYSMSPAYESIYALQTA